MLTAKLVCSWVSLNRLLSTTLALASRLSVMTSSVLPPDDASLTSAMPSRSPASTSSWMRAGDRRAARLVRQLGDDDLDGALLVLLDRRRGPHLHAAAAGAVGVDDPGPAEDAGAGREVRPLDELHQVVGRGLRVVDQVDRGVDDLAEVVRRDVRGHADGDALAAVDEQVGEARREHDGLLGACRRSWAPCRRCPRRCRRAAASPAGAAGTRCSARRPGRSRAMP